MNNLNLLVNIFISYLEFCAFLCYLFVYYLCLSHHVYVFNHVLKPASLLTTVIMIHSYGTVNTTGGIQASGQ